jgi:23S rRNA pseudouridine1911/1915/1917 synthase
MIARDQRTVAGSGERLDRHLLNAYPWLDRATVETLLAAGQIRLNGRPAKKGAKLAAGDILDCRDVPEPADLKLQPNPDLPLKIVYEDDHVLALDKPAGQPTHPLRWAETDTLANALVARYPALAGIGDDRLFPALLHRLDTQTSGLVLAAKTAAAYAELRAQFRRFTVQKHYLALVHGRVEKPGSLAAPLTHQTRSPCKMAVARNPDKVPRNDLFAAETAWTPLETGREFSLLDVTIYTGVTHQIRCHLAAAGHPIAGDALYGPPSSPSTINHQPPTNSRHWLHAARLICTHPATGRSLDVACRLPPDWPAAK